MEEQDDQYPNDSDSFKWAVLGFVVPLAGLILFLVWRRKKPKAATHVGMGALVGTLLFMIILLIILIDLLMIIVQKEGSLPPELAVIVEWLKAHGINILEYK